MNAQSFSMVGTKFFSSVVFASAIFAAANAHALELDWTGQFRAESHVLNNYTLDGSTGTDARAAAGGYTVPGAGTANSNFQTLFMRLKPRVIVNDIVSIRSELWFGDIAGSVFGEAAPTASGQRNSNSTYSRGATVTAQRLWADVVSELGMVQIGRAPLQWGLGVVWNAGDAVSDRAASTGDVVRLVTKFGAFIVTPSFVKYSAGNTVGGACAWDTGVTACQPSVGTGGLTDYSLSLRYDNPDDEFDVGVNLIRRIGGSVQDSATGYTGGDSTVPGVTNTVTWDIYARRKLGAFSFGVEAPLISGQIAGGDYKSYAVAAEARYQSAGRMEYALRAGTAPGQQGGSEKYKAFFFHPNYRPGALGGGLVMFNYQLQNIGGVNVAQSANTDAASLFNAGISNAHYLSLGSAVNVDRWRFTGEFMYARAGEVAKAGSTFYNHTTRTYHTNATGVDQGSSLGWELDLGAQLRWDDHFVMSADVGMFKPGNFYAFSNTATGNALGTLNLAVFKVGVNF